MSKQGFMATKRARHHLRWENTLIGPRFSRGKYQARRRELSWTLTRAEYEVLVDRWPCHYCGGPLEQTGTGLDRKDNGRGYEPDNVVPCCRRCNAIKSSYFTHLEMLLIAKVLQQIRLSRQRSSRREAS